MILGKTTNTIDIEWVDGESLSPAPWRATYVLKPELRVLAESLADYGWLQPIVVQKGTGMIIDGHHRWEIAGSMKIVQKRYKNAVPVVFHDCSDIEARMMHLRLNRGRGTPVAKRVSRIIRDCVSSRKYDEKFLKKKLAMHYEEIDILMDGTLLKSRKVSEHRYSNAWIPVEAPAGTVENASMIERPPNADR